MAVPWLGSDEKSPYERLSGTTILRAVDGTSVQTTALWEEDERALLVFGRSFG